MAAFGKLLVALLVFGAIGYFCVYRHAPLIEAAVDSEVRAAIAPTSALFVAWDTSGRDVTLTGSVASDDTRARLVERVANAPGVRVVIDQLRIEVPTESDVAAASTELTLDATGLTLDGVGPSPEAIDELQRLATSEIPGLEFRSDARIRPGLNERWPQRMAAALAAVSQLTRGSAALTDERLVVRGRVAGPAERQAVDDALSRLIESDADLVVDVALDTTSITDTAAASCQQQFSQALANEQIRFASGSAEIDAASDALLSTLAGIATDCPDARIEIAGHTDSMGDPAFNDALSEQRATAVRDNLIARGIAPERLTARGYGSRRPIADNASRAGRVQNRRIELIVSVAD
ncbi:MAG: OmpA family protein [Pseudomonadota bacterium]